MTMRKVWPVSTGSYSDWNIHALYESKELANQAAEKLSKEGGWIFSDAMVDKPLMVSDQLPVALPVLTLRCRIYENGTVEEGEPEIENDWDFQDGEDLTSQRWGWYTEGHWGMLSVVGRDHDRVRKVYSDRKAEIVGAWEFWNTMPKQGHLR